MRTLSPLGLVLVLAGCSCAPKKELPPVDAGASEASVALTIVATCAEVQGTAEVRRAGKPYWEALTPGSTLRDGDWVRTEALSMARIELLAGQTLELGPEATVVVERRLADSGVAGPRVAIEAGEVRASAAADDDELTPLVLRTPEGTTTVLQPKKGAERTVFRLAATSKGTEVAVVKGTGEVRSGAQTLSLERGQTVTSDGKGELVAAELPDFPASLAPGIDARLKYEGDAGVRLEWSSVAEATGYRVQLAGDLAFTDDVRTIETTGPSFFLRPGAKGLQVWRVATRTASTVGEYGFARRVFFEAEEPSELLLGPEDGLILPYSGAVPVVTFSWQGSTGSPTYRLFVSRDVDPRVNPVVSLVTTSQQAASSLPAGEYHWGVYKEEGAELRPLFLQPRSLVVKSVSRAVVKTPRAVSDWE